MMRYQLFMSKWSTRKRVFFSFEMPTEHYGNLTVGVEIYAKDAKAFEGEPIWSMIDFECSKRALQVYNDSEVFRNQMNATIKRLALHARDVVGDVLNLSPRERRKVLHIEDGHWYGYVDFYA